MAVSSKSNAQKQFCSLPLPSQFISNVSGSGYWMKNIIMFSITLMLNQLRGGKRRSLEVILEMPPRAVFLIGFFFFF